MSQSTQGAYRTFRPIVADADSDGTPDSQGLWQTGGRYLDPLVQFSRSDTAGLTNPADIIEYILRDIGLGDADIDAAAFAAAKTTFAAWGLEWHFGLWTKQDRQKLLAQLLTACAATLDVGVRVGLRVLGGPVGVVGLGDVIRTSKNGPGTFGYSSKTASAEDAGYIGWRQSTSPEDELLRVLVPVDDSTDNPSTNILALGMITNPDHAQRIGSIYYQRKLTGKAAIVATLSSVWAGLQAGDTVTISPAMYGGPYPVEIDSVTIGKDLQIEIRATRYACTISQFSGLSFSSISLAIDSSTNPNNVWRLPSSGPDGAVGLNAMTGRLRIGDDIVLDAGAGALEMGNLTEGPGMSYRDGVLQLLGAALRIAASAAADVRSDLNVENGATAGATWGVNVSGQPTSLADLDATAANELDGKAVTFYQEEEPTGSTGDIWFDTNNNYRMYRYDGTSWVAVQDSAAASAAAQTAQNNADLAQATADGKVVTFYQTTAPTADGTGDLWYNSDDKKLKRWDGSSWDEVSNAFNNTSELTDGASLGLTATWSNVSGSGKPADNADKTKTVIDGGLITTGTIKDADDSLVINFSDKTITFYNTLKLNNYSEIYAPSIGTLMLVIASEQDIRIQSDQEVFLSGTAVRTNTLSRINADGGYGPSIEGTQFLTKLNELTNDWELHVKHNGTYRGHVVLV
jgi:hypothetical protein